MDIMLDHHVAWDFSYVAKGWSSLAWYPKFRNLCKEKTSDSWERPASVRCNLTKDPDA